MRQNKYLQNLLLNWPAKILSLVFALLVYTFIQYSTLDTRIVTIPLEVTLPDALVAESLVPSQVQVQIKGDDSIIYLVDPNAIVAAVDFSDVKSEGIAVRSVVLHYDEHLFDTAKISFLADPIQFRILFSFDKEL
ncbi:MAG: CdaR family protein [Sphaerochaeta sp.]|jgi:hypothetical protein|nr:hypothetical protein [Spirochaetales bacterium]